MGALSPWHLIIILFIIVLFFGAKRLPGLARGLGSSAREFKKGLHGEEPPQTTSVSAQSQSTAAQDPARPTAAEQPPGGPAHP